MTDFSLVLDITQYNVNNPGAIFTAAIFFAAALLNFNYTMPALDKAAAYLRAGKTAFASMPEDPTHHQTLATWLPGVFGMWLFLVYLIAGSDFVAYIQDGIVFWPDYGHPVPWIVNVFLALGALTAAGVFVSYIRIFGWSGGLVPGIAAMIVALACFAGGILSAPLQAIYFIVVRKRRKMFIAYPLWGMKELAGRAFGEKQAA